jgi:hypothetical protein
VGRAVYEIAFRLEVRSLALYQPIYCQIVYGTQTAVTDCFTSDRLF